MRGSSIAAAGLVALGAVAALAATSLAGGDDADVVSPDRVLQQVAVEPVSRAETGGRLAQRGPRRGMQEVSYFETPDPIQIPPKTEEAVEVNKCPKGSEAVGGYFATANPGTFLDLNQPSRDSARKWRIGAYNSTMETEQAIFGVVCISDVK